MAESLSRKRRVRGGHRSSTTRTIAALYEAIEITEDLESVMTKLEQCKITLKEKLEILKQLDEKILELVEDGDVDNEIEQADTFKERIHVVIIESNKALGTKQSSRITATPIPSSGETSSDSPVAVTSSESSTVPVISTPTTSDPVTIVTPLIMSPSITTTTSTISVPATESVSTPMTPSTRAVAPLMFSPSISTVPIPSHRPFMGFSSLSMAQT